jgi:hypothetical protein
MYKRFFQVFLLSIILSWIHIGTVNAVNDKPRPLEEIYTEIGYKAVEEAVQEFEQRYNQDLKLPSKVPPINFTHQFGRFNDLDGNVNDSLELQFLNENSPESHYKIDVRPANYKIPMKGENAYKLKSGDNAIYTNVRTFNLFVFEQDGWQYILSIDKRVSNQVTPEIFVEIANSVQ